MCVFVVVGVIYVCVYSVIKVIVFDYGGFFDFYCVVFLDRRRVRVIFFFYFNLISMKVFFGGLWLMYIREILYLCFNKYVCK